MNFHPMEFDVIAEITNSPFEVLTHADVLEAVPVFVEDEISAAFEMIVEPVTTRYEKEDRS